MRSRIVSRRHRLAIGRFSSTLTHMADAEPPPYYEPPTPFAQQRSDLRAGIGHRIGATLDATPRLWRLCSSPKQPIQLYIGDEFLDAETCRQMCEKIDAGSYPS